MFNSKEDEEKSQFRKKIKGVWVVDIDDGSDLCSIEVNLGQDDKVEIKVGCAGVKHQRVLSGTYELRESIDFKSTSIKKAYTADFKITKVCFYKGGEITKAYFYKDGKRHEAGGNVEDYTYTFLALTCDGALYFPMREDGDEGGSPQCRLLELKNEYKFIRPEDKVPLNENLVLNVLLASEEIGKFRHPLSLLTLSGVTLQKQNDETFVLPFAEPLVALDPFFLKEACDNSICYQIHYYSREGFSISQQSLDDSKEDCYHDVGSTYERLSRFFWIHSLFNILDRENRLYPLDHWKTKENIEVAYQQEKEQLSDDVHLRLYWIFHFGLLHDPRYDTLKPNVNAERPLVDAIALIDSLRAQTVSYQRMSTGLLKRYSDFVCAAGWQLAYEPLWYSLLNNPERPNCNAYWIVKRADSDQAWNSLNQQLAQADLSLQGMAYIQANNPMLSDAEQKQFANLCLNEMYSCRQEYGSGLNNFLSVYNISRKVDDFSLLATTIAYYFRFIRSEFNQGLIDNYNEIIYYLKDSGVKDISLYLPLEETLLERFDHFGYRQLKLRRYSDRVRALCTLNQSDERAGDIRIDGLDTCELIYSQSVDRYLSMGFQRVDHVGQLAEQLPIDLHPKAIFKRLSYADFCEQYPNICLDSDWWEGCFIDVYEKNVEIHQTIDSNTNDIFDKGVAKIFLQKLTVHGNIENRSSNCGAPILVVGDVQANAIVAGEGYLNFEGNVALKDLLVISYKHGRLEMGKSLEARAILVDNYHGYSFPKVTIVDYYWDGDWDDEEDEWLVSVNLQIKKEHLTTGGLVETFPGASWIEVEEYEYDDEDIEVYHHIHVSEIVEGVDNFGAYCDRLESHYPAAKGGGEEK